MPELDVQQVASSTDCKVPGCPNEAKSARGPYAGLCDYHIAQRVRAARAANGSTGPREQPPRRPPTPHGAAPQAAPVAVPGESYQARAKRLGKQLTAAGKEVDKLRAVAARKRQVAQRAAALAAEAARVAEQDLAAAERRWQALLRELGADPR